MVFWPKLLYDAGATNILVYDVGEALPPFNFDRFPSLRHVKTAHSTDTVVLPFSDDEFDVVLSVGVLEHVPFMADSLKELHRVLKVEGIVVCVSFSKPFFMDGMVWHLVNMKSGHARKLTLRELHAMLVCNGWLMLKPSVGLTLPKTFYPLPPFVVRFVSLFTPIIYLLDAILSRVPIVNLLCNSNECHATAQQALR